MATGYQVGIQYRDEWSLDRHIVPLAELAQDDEARRAVALATFEAMHRAVNATLKKGYVAMFLAETHVDVIDAFRQLERPDGRVITTDNPRIEGILSVVGIGCSILKRPETLVT